MRTDGKQHPSEQGDNDQQGQLAPPPAGQTPNTQSLNSYESVRQYVNRTLCDLENLEPHHFPLSERTLQRAGSPCGVMFVLHGPRQLQVSAVWEIDRNVIWFYNAIGQRCQQKQLEQPVAVECAIDHHNRPHELALATAG